MDIGHHAEFKILCSSDESQHEGCIRLLSQSYAVLRSLHMPQLIFNNCCTSLLLFYILLTVELFFLFY
jgi:hypothetical protein